MDLFFSFFFKKTYLKQFAVLATPQGYWSTCGAQIHTHLSLQLTSELDWHLANQIVLYKVIAFLLFLSFHSSQM